MEGHGISLPDALIPYCRTLYERLQAEVEQDSSKRDAIIWVVNLLRVKEAHALQVLQEREAQVVTEDTTTAAAPTAEVEHKVTDTSRETIDLVSSDDESGHSAEAVKAVSPNADPVKEGQ